MDVDILQMRTLSVLYGHSLRFAVAKKHHNQAMRTSFTSQRPESMSDRDAVLNNISIESHICNMAKLNYAEEHHDTMVTRIKQTKLSKQDYDSAYRRTTTDDQIDNIFTLEDLTAISEDLLGDSTSLFEVGATDVDAADEGQGDDGDEGDNEVQDENEA